MSDSRSERRRFFSRLVMACSPVLWGEGCVCAHCSWLVLLLGGAEDAGDGAGEFVPLAGFEVELRAALRREGVKLCAAIVFGSSVGGGDPFALDEAMERGIERALLDLEHFVGAEFDGLGDGVAVRGAEQERAEDEQVERALEHFDAF